MNIEQEIITEMHYTDEQLQFKLGNEIRGLGATPVPKKQIIQQAKIWLAEKNKEFKPKICQDKTILLLANKDKSEGDSVMLISGIADLIMSITNGISPVTVAILIVREGLLKYCEIYWKVHK